MISDSVWRYWSSSAGSCLRTAAVLRLVPKTSVCSCCSLEIKSGCLDSDVHRRYCSKVETFLAKMNRRNWFAAMHAKCSSSRTFSMGEVLLAPGRCRMIASRRLLILRVQVGLHLGLQLLTSSENRCWVSLQAKTSMMLPRCHCGNGRTRIGRMRGTQNECQASIVLRENARGRDER